MHNMHVATLAITRQRLARIQSDMAMLSMESYREPALGQGSGDDVHGQKMLSFKKALADEQERSLQAQSTLQDWQDQARKLQEQLAAEKAKNLHLHDQLGA